MTRGSALGPSAIRRTCLIGLVAALLAVAFLASEGPSVAAASDPPFFSPSAPVDGPPAYIANQPSLALGSDGVAYVVFTAWGGSTGNDIFSSNSADGGRTWTVPVRVNDDSGGATQSDPSLALDHLNNLYVVWTDARGPTEDIYFAKSTDGGSIFSANVLVNVLATGSVQREPDIALDPVDRDLVHVVWTNFSAVTGPDILYANSTDGGIAFNGAVRVNSDSTPTEQNQPAIAVAANRSLHVVWSDPRDGTKGRDIRFSISTNRGASWGVNRLVNDDSGNAAQVEPTIAVQNGAVHVAWTDYRSTTGTAPDIFATRSTNGGISFAANVQVNDDTAPATQSQPDLAAGGGTIQLAWVDFRAGAPFWPYDIYTASSTDGIAWSENVKVNEQVRTDQVQTPSIGLDASGNVVVVWLRYTGSAIGILASSLDVVAPTAVAGPSASVDQGMPLTFDAGGSTDNFGIAGYAWDFGDGSSASASSPTHSYPDAGAYTATLTVWDHSGNRATATRAVTVRDTADPVALGGGDRAVEEGDPLFFDASASRDNVGVTGYEWNFGDGSSATTATATHTYARPGSYTATLTVTDAAGNSATTTFSVTVRANALMGWFQLLAGIVGALAAAVGVLLWMVLRRRRSRPFESRPSSPSQSAPAREADPLDMTFPPASPPEER